MGKLTTLATVGLMALSSCEQKESASSLAYNDRKLDKSLAIGVQNRVRELCPTPGDHTLTFPVFPTGNHNVSSNLSVSIWTKGEVRSIKLEKVEDYGPKGNIYWLVGEDLDGDGFFDRQSQWSHAQGSTEKKVFWVMEPQYFDSSFFVKNMYTYCLLKDLKDLTKPKELE